MKYRRKVSTQRRSEIFRGKIKPIPIVCFLTVENISALKEMSTQYAVGNDASLPVSVQMTLMTLPEEVRGPPEHYFCLRYC